MLEGLTSIPDLSFEHRPERYVVRVSSSRDVVVLRLDLKDLAERREIELTNELIRRTGR